MWSLLIGCAGIIIIALVISMLVSHEEETQANITGVLFLIGCIALIVGLIAGGYQYPVLEVTNKTDIVCIKDNSDTHGGFFLFGGSFNQDPCYYYYARTDNNGYKLEHVIADSVIVYEDAPTGTGYLSKTSKIIDPVWEKAHRHWLLYISPSYNSKIEIHVPSDSISREFKLDAE